MVEGFLFLKIMALFVLGILLTLFLVVVFEDVGIVLLAGLGLGGLFAIIYQLECIKKMKKESSKEN